jgi:hypothetical protein
MKRRYLADTSAPLVWSTLAGMFTEIVIAGLTVEQSLYARLTALPVILITARPYGVYRDWIWRTWRGDEGAARRLIVDTAAIISFQLPLYWMILAFVGATLWQIAAASVTAIAILAVSGRPYGVLLEAFRRLFGVTPRAERPAP